MDLTGFKVTDYLQESADFKPVPPGWYTANVTNTEMKDTRSGDGSKYLEVEWAIQGVWRNEANDPADTYVGRRVWERLNVKNMKSDAAVSIAKQNLAKCMNACGIKELVNGHQDLRGARCLIRLKYVPETNQWEAKNEVHGYRKLENGEGPAYVEAPKAPAPVAKKPWEQAIKSNGGVAKESAPLKF